MAWIFKLNSYGYEIRQKGCYVLRIKRSRFGSQYDRIDKEALRLTKGRTLKMRSLEELLRFAKLLKLRQKRCKK